MKIKELISLLENEYPLSSQADFDNCGLLVGDQHNEITSVLISLDCTEEVVDEAIKKGYTVIGMTASGEEAKQKIKNTYKLNFDFYLCDEKALKTVVRSNPGILELNKKTTIHQFFFDLEKSINEEP